jgi:anti-sigma factor RsiW
MIHQDVGSHRNYPHQKAYELLPWYVNGTLETRERLDVMAHLPTCHTCQAEVTKCHNLTEVLHVTGDIERSPSSDRLSRLLSRINTVEVRHSWAHKGWERLRVRSSPNNPLECA